MPQEIRVLKCFACDMFQVDIVKKSNKWQCKVCNSKQTLRREYFRGSGFECRAKVQELNMKKGEKQTRKDNQLLALLGSDDIDECNWTAIENAGRSHLNTQPEYILDPSHGVDSEKIKQNLFNLSSTQKWSRAVDEDANTTKVSKKSKWEKFV